MRAAALAFALGALTVTAAVPVQGQEERPSLTYQGLGEIRIGMTKAELEALGFDGQAYEGQTEEDAYYCTYVENPEAYPGIDLMLNENRLVRIDVREGPWQSWSGATLGMTKAQILDIYGDAMTVDFHPYGDQDLESWAYMKLTSSNGRYAAIFELQDGKIAMFRMGEEGAVGFIEGCA